MADRVRAAFLEQQLSEGMALAEASDLLTLVPVAGTPPERYLADFRCHGLVRAESGQVVEADHFVVGIWFPDDYLRQVDPAAVLALLRPGSIWHPNVSNRGPWICVGRIAPGTPLVDLLYRVFEVITYSRVTMREDDALNREACAWARAHRDRFPVDDRPHKRRPMEFAIEPAAVGR
jgi:hypothetical protein